jgi:hyperosmotically inducible periplasmic protein
VYEPAPHGLGDRLVATVLAGLVVLASVMGSCAHRPAGIDDDLALAQRVESRLEVDRDLRAFGLEAAATDGTVVLRGRVEDDVDRRRAEAIARTTPGTERVVNAIRITLSPFAVDSPFRDAWVATRAKARLVANPDLDASGVTVEANRGVVVLSGRVASTQDRLRAERLVRQMRGITQVVNRLEVTEDARLG